MEEDVIATINDFLKSHTGGTDTSGPEVVVQTLAGSYRGYAEMTKLMAGWLDSVQPKKKSAVEQPDEHHRLLPSSAVTTRRRRQQPASEELIYEFLKTSIIQRYQPKLLEHVLEAKAEPIWLECMLDDSKWRLMLIELAEKHKSCGLLHYIIQRISEAGHHKEIASITSASTYFSVFHGVFMDAFQRIRAASSDELVADDLASLRKICGQNAYTYMYTQHFLREFEAKFSSNGQQHHHACTARIRQELHAATYREQGTKLKPFVLHTRKDIAQQFPRLSRCILTMLMEGECSEQTARELHAVYVRPSAEGTIAPPVAHIRDPMVLRMLIDALFNSSSSALSASRKADTLYILSYAVCAKDERRDSAAADEDNEKDLRHVVELIDFEKTRQCLEQASDICNSDHTLGYNISSSGVVEELSSLMEYPVVAMGVLQWIRTAICTPSFHNSSLFHVCFPSFLGLIKTSVDAHPMQWPSSFEILVESLRLRPDLNPVKALDLKRDILKAMVHMMTRGYVLPVLHFVYRSTDELDAALLRNFVGFVMDRVAPPYSPRFAQAMARLLLHPKISTAIKTSPESTQKRLLEFIKSCRQTEGLLSKQHSQSLKALRSYF